MTHAPERPKFIGAAVKRLEDPRLVTGAGRYLDDLSLPGMLHLRVVRSEMAHARISQIHKDTLREIHPDALLFTAEDLGDYGIRSKVDFPQAQQSVQPLLAREKVRFVGEPVAAVLMSDPYQVEDAAELVFIDYDPLPVLSDPASALAPDAPMLFDGWKRNIFIEQTRRGGDIDKARREAAHVIRRTFRNQRQAACRWNAAAPSPNCRRSATI